MTQMSATQLKRFSAVAGACSIVTETEALHDRSLTIDRSEKAVISLIYPLDSFTRMGGETPDGEQERFPFIVHGRNNLSLATVRRLAIKYPKSGKNELRLYMSQADGFEAEPGDMFYVLYKANDTAPHVGFMPLPAWTALMAEVPEAFDTDDELYQQVVFSELAKQPVEVKGLRFPRSAAAAVAALEAARFRCELEPAHPTFISDATGKPYVEAHHLMPLSEQTNAPSNLDVPANIVALCPTCHRRVHLEEKNRRIELLVDLHRKRKERLKEAGLDFGLSELLKAYGLM